MKFDDEKFIDRNIAEICKGYDQINGANRNLTRIGPDYIDGLKLVARRTIYIIFKKDNGKTFRKVAAITGDTIGRLHMHGPSSVYASLVGLAQWWNNNIPLIEGHGNFGSVAGDVAGADRYIKARLSEFALDCYFSEWGDSSVDMILGADGETDEPLYLPAKYPVVLLNGSLGIGYGMASNIPPYNFKEVVETTVRLMKNPESKFVLIPDSPTGCDIVISDFQKICDVGTGAYTFRSKYEIDSENNIIRITNLPYQISVNSIREKIADIKEKNGLPELINMKDFSGKEVDLRLHIRDDVNPYKFMKKLIANVGGLDKSYPVNITVVNDYQTHDFSIRRLLLEWIRYRREQKRVIVSHKRTKLMGEQRTNDVKLFILSESNLEETLKIFRTSTNRSHLEKRLIDTYYNSPIKMDSLQARTLSNMKFHELCTDAYDACIARRKELVDELIEVENILNDKNGIDNIIIGELRNGVKKFGYDRKSSVVAKDISIETEIAGECILQLSSDGMMNRRVATNVHEEPIPIDSNGFAVKVENDSAFIAIDEDGLFAFIKVAEIPIDQDVPLNRYIKQPLSNIIALLPFDINSDLFCSLVSKEGVLKKLRIADMKPSKRPCIDISKTDKLINGIVTRPKSSKDILIYTNHGRGQRLNPDDIKATGLMAKGGNGFKLNPDESIVGCYAISPENQYLLYITTKGKARLNLTQYLPQRNSKHDQMVNLISIPDRDYLLRVIGCNKLDKLQVFYTDSSSETVEIQKIPEGTMSTDPKKITAKNAVSNSIVKVKLI